MNRSLFILIVIVLIIFVSYKLYRMYIRMNISQNGMDFIKGLEGVRYTMYLDSEGYPTIGVGHLIKPNEEYLKTAKLTNKEVDELFKKDLKSFVDAANNAITAPMKQHEFDAVVSVLFNIGKGWGDGIGSEASFIKLINSTGSLTAKVGTKEDIARAIMKFKIPSSIIERRAKEARLYVNGNYRYSDLSGLDVYKKMTA